MYEDDHLPIRIPDMFSNVRALLRSIEGTAVHAKQSSHGPAEKKAKEMAREDRIGCQYHLLRCAILRRRASPPPLS